MSNETKSVILDAFIAVCGLGLTALGAYGHYATKYELGSNLVLAGGAAFTAAGVSMIVEEFKED